MVSVCLLLCLAALQDSPPAPTVPPITETVVVTNRPLPRRTTGSLGRVVSEETIAALPLNGRNVVPLVALAPGASLPPGSQFPRINGGRPRTNEYLFDGISVLQPEPGQVAYFPTIDAIQEFRVETNSPPAEFGRFNGGVVNLRTKAGSNALHGTAFEFFRHEALNARNVFAPAGPRPEFRRNQFGGVLGGPIARDRTFFFADYQGQRQRIDRTVISTVPTVLQRQGIFTEPIAGRVPVIRFVDNAIPEDRVDPIAASLIERYPLPTADGTANNFRRTAAEHDDHDQWTVRVDHRWSAGSNQVFGRLTHVRGTFMPVTPLPDGSGVTTGTLGPQGTTASAFASSYQRTLSMTLLNELRVGDTRRSVDRTAVPLPTYVITGYQQLGSPPNTQTAFATGVTEIADTLTWIRGRHAVKAGFDWRWQRLDVSRRRHTGCSRSTRWAVTSPAWPTRERRSQAFSSDRCSSSPSTCSGRRSRSAHASRSTSSRTNGRSRIG